MPINPRDDRALGMAARTMSMVQQMTDQGTQVVTGPQGQAGVTGPQGLKGDPGEKGDKGDKGDPGIDGANGKDGKNGIDGAVGPQGEQGPKGDTGPRGEQGLPGTQGFTGIQGDPGPKGEVGPIGPVGPQGPKGDQGIQGPKGDTGATGPQGPKGDAGPQGLTGTTRLKYAVTIDIPAQQSGTYTHTINLGANVFSARPVVSVEVESNSGNFDNPRIVVGGTVSAGFTLSITLTNRKAALDISLSALLNISLLATSIPALKLHVLAFEPV